MKFFFMRHAHSVSQLDKTVVVGRATAAPLSDIGKEQAQKAARALEGRPIGAIYTSTCVRAAQTAATVGERLGVPVEPSEYLIERSHGDFEGRKKDEVYTDEVLSVIHADQFRWIPPGGEALADVLRRLATFLRSVDRTRGERVLVVTHLMVMWSLFYGCTRCHHGLLPRLHVDNTALVEVDCVEDPLPGIPLDRLRLVSWNKPVTSQ